MATLAHDIRNARRAVERVLDELGVRAFVFTVEQKETGWLLSVECATDGGWQRVALAVDPAELSASLNDPAVRAKLCRDWAPHLRSCAS
jgi:hypothetical protein